MRSMFRSKQYATLVVDLCTFRTHPSPLTFIPTEKLVLNYACFELREIFRNSFLA